MLYKLVEFETYHGYVLSCGNLSSGHYGYWALPAQLMNISTSDFIQLLISKYKAKIIPVYKEDRLLWLWYYWDKEDLMSCRAFKNEVNLLARNANFII